ncbi:glycosyltransferase [Paludibacter jiangxiensis]|uniref:Glycosyltransferase n=1 Tax=Paludibacter jiangxiensis TaxID=681398 RepID=A0A171A3J1_9BACT|nr:glycosyltransferase [Paludibacter jiangxiensis]GAT63256.1 glycosyltransferase [Paludibacter jiangxiensis]
MNVLHTISSLGVNSGGPPLSTSLTVVGLRDEGINAEILSYQLASSKDNLIIDGDFIHLLPIPSIAKLAYSGKFASFLNKHTVYDLYHLQCIWQYPTYIGAKIAREKGIPYIITPRGMLYPQEFVRSGRIKKLALSLFLKRDLQQAACVQATCHEEMQHLRDLGITSPIAVIPNPIDTEKDKENILEKQDVRRFGYLGRIHPRKNIERLPYAWDILGDKVKDCELVIIGGGDIEYETFLKAEVVRLGLKNVIFTGFLSGIEKEKTIQSLSYLVVPSDFENFGMIIAEALLYGIPVITSKGTPWQELETYQCGWWIDNDVESISKTMEKAIYIPEEERIAMGKRGHSFIRDNYSVKIVANKMIELYKWILQKGKKPDFVFLD